MGTQYQRGVDWYMQGERKNVGTPLIYLLLVICQRKYYTAKGRFKWQIPTK